MADTIKIDVAKLTSAISKLTALVDSVDSRRRTASAASPIAMPSLGDTQLGLKVQRLRDRLPELQTRLDLAKLLDEKGTGHATYWVPGPDSLEQTKLLIASYLATSLKSLKVDDPGSRERAAELAALLAKYGTDITVAANAMQALGPEGLTRAIRNLRSITAAQPPYWAGVKDPSGENKAVLALQDQMGKSLALMLSTASKRLGQDWGKRFAHDPWAATVLLRYADKQNLPFSKNFFQGVGHSLKEREQGDPLAWDFASRDPDNTSFGTESFTDYNPMREYLNTADNSTETAQSVMADEQLREYFLRDRRYLTDDPLLDQAGKVLEKATIGAARSTNAEEARTAADISSHVLWMTNDPTKPNPAFTDEVGGILATYIMDVDDAVNGGDSGPGAAGMDEYRMGLGPDDGLPRYQIGLDQATLKNALGFVREDEVAMRKLGQSITLYNQVRMDWGATHHQDNTPGDAFHKTVRESAQLASFVTNELSLGRLDDVGRRIKTMDYMTAPLDNLNSVVSLGKIPLGELINDGIIGAARDAAADHTMQAALHDANAADGRATLAMKIQAVYSLVRVMPDDPSLPSWPTENGHPKAPNELTNNEVADLRKKIDNRGGVTGTAADGIEDAWRTVDERYRD